MHANKVFGFLLACFIVVFGASACAKTQVIFLIDASASVDNREYAQIHLALRSMKLPQNLKQGTVHFVEWSTGPLLVASGNLNEFSKVLEEYWQKGRQMSGSTAVGYALNFVMQEVFDPSALEHYVILITDGDNNFGPSPLETNYRTWSIINKVNTSIVVIDDLDWLVQYYQPLKIGFKSLVVHARNFNELEATLQLLINSIFGK